MSVIIENIDVYKCSLEIFCLPYSRKISRTINFAVFTDFTTALKINFLYCIMQW